MAPSSGLWAPLAMKVMRQAFKKTTRLVQLRLSQLTKRPITELEPILVRSNPRHGISRAAWLRQSKGRWYTTTSTVNAAIRRYMSSGPGGAKFDRSSFPPSATSSAVSRLTSRAPFASTLRPNLTGGAFPRTAGGYSLGGGRVGGPRYFSHTPAAPAQVVNNVSAAVRAFWLSGNKAQFDGLNSRGEKKYRTISTLQDETTRKVQSISKFVPGSYVDFNFNPTVTALTPLGAGFPFSPVTPQAAPSLNTEGFLDLLSVDFARALKDLAAVMNDLKRLSSLGDLTITLEGTSTLRVRFPGCDAETVERLCDEVGIQRGIVRQDSDFDDKFGGHMALRFPFASTSEDSLSSPGGSLRSQDGFEMDDYDDLHQDPGISSPEGYESMDDTSTNGSAYFKPQSEYDGSSDYEGVEGLHRFLEQCDRYRRI